MGVNLMFEAGRLAERRGWQSADVVETGALGSVPPGPGQVIVVVSEAGLAVSEARAVAALTSSGKEVAVVTGAALSDDVVAWLPSGCLHLAGEPQGAGWTVSDGLITLTPDEEDLWNERILDPIQARDAESLAQVLRQVSVGVAWDRPIFVPSTPECYRGILNSDGYDRFPIPGMRDEEYLRFEEDLVTGMWRVDHNPLNILGWGGDRYLEFNAVLTLNISLGGSPILLVCGPYFESQTDDDYSGCVVREREHNLSGFQEKPGTLSQLPTLQARPQTQPDDLEPLPPWFSSLPSGSQDVLLKLFDAWASGFFRAVVAWGVDWFRRYGKGIDAALQADWETLIRRLEETG